MTLGEQISRLRTARDMSQEDLANELQVSRQSISKWETNSSVPELDKLLKLSELFGITLDELVKGNPFSESDPQCADSSGDTGGDALEHPLSGGAHKATAARTISGTQKIIGIILLCFSALASLLLLFASGSLLSSILALPFLLCGVLCLMARRRAGLWCGWVWFACLMLYFRYATGITWRLTLQTIGFQPEWNYMRLAIAWVMLLAMVLMVFCTARSFRTITFAPIRRNAALLAAGWGLWLLLPRALNAWVFQPWLLRLSSPNGLLGSGYTAYSLTVTAENCLQFLTLNVLVVCTLALLRGRIGQK